MSKENNDGGPAFAHSGHPETDKSYQCHAQTGMSMREYYKAKIMQGFCANPAIFAPNASCGWSLVNVTDNDLIAYAGHLAEKMIEESTAKPQ